MCIEHRLTPKSMWKFSLFCLRMLLKKEKKTRSSPNIKKDQKIPFLLNKCLLKIRHGCLLSPTPTRRFVFATFSKYLIELIENGRISLSINIFMWLGWRGCHKVDKNEHFYYKALRRTFRSLTSYLAKFPWIGKTFGIRFVLTEKRVWFQIQC